jgi:hypothetical protein
VRGSPLIRALLAFLAIALLGWPLWHLTSSSEAVATPAAPPPASEAKAIGLQLTFTAVPKSFVIRHLEKDVWSEAAPQAEVEREVTIPFPENGVDLIVKIEWPEGAPLAAARVRLTDPAGDAHEKSVWGQGTVEEVLTFP